MNYIDFNHYTKTCNHIKKLVEKNDCYSVQNKQSVQIKYGWVRVGAF